MAYGGGYFTTYTKKMPGTYVNFSSALKASSVLSDRGIVFFGDSLNWGASGVTTLTLSDLETLQPILGYSQSADEMIKIREIFQHATKLYLYRLDSGGTKASNTYATAKYPGTRGNAITIIIANDTEHENKFVVSTALDGTIVDSQDNIDDIDDLEDNDYVDWKTGEITLTATAGTPLASGANGSVTGQSYQDMLNTAESYVFNILAYEGNDNTTKGLFKAFTQRMREEIGANFQTVLYDYSANYEGIINVKNSADLVPWVAGAEAGCAVNASIENMTYDGEKTVSANYTQTQLIMAMDSGELVFHKVDDDYKVLKDINSLTTFTTQKGKNFGDNTTIRVNDQIGNDVAVMFNNQIMGKVQNDSEGRLYVWDKINDIMQALATARAINNYDSADLKVFAIEGDSSAIGAEIMYTPLNMLNKLYLTCIVA